MIQTGFQKRKDVFLTCMDSLFAKYSNRSTIRRQGLEDRKLISRKQKEIT